MILVRSLVRGARTATISLRMRMRCSLIVVMAVSLASVRGAHAQRMTEAVVGSRVRLDTTDGALLTGTVVSVDSDSVRVSTHSSGAVVALPLSRVLSYDVSRGRERGRGAKRGALAGGAVGLALVVSSLRGDTVDAKGRRDDRRLAVPIAIGLTALGAAIGAALAPERWEVPAWRHARLSVVACRTQCLAIRYRW